MPKLVERASIFVVHSGKGKERGTNMGRGSRLKMWCRKL